MRNYILILLVFSLGCLAQCQSTTINNVQKFNSDLDHLKEVLYTSHPGTFIYITEDSLNQVFSSLKFNDDETPTALDLEKKVRIVLSRIGCIHTNPKSTFKPDKKSLPFSFYAIGNDVWITADLTDSLSTLKGSRVLAINNHEAQTIIETMKDYHASDGYNTSFKYALINEATWFSYLYQYYFDKDSIHDYTIVTSTFDTLHITKNNIKIDKPAKREPSANDTLLYYGENISVNFDAANNIATLKITSFSGPPAFGKYISKNRFRKILKEIKKRGFNNLAIDLRGNLGGNGAIGNSLLSFFVTEDHDILVKKHKGNIFKHAVIGSKIGVVLNSLLGPLFASRTPTFTHRESKAKIRKSKNGFQGNLFVITDGFTGSTASIVASILKYKANATMVGTETGGGENDLNGYFYPTIKLPNSSIKIQMPQYHIDLNVITNKGSGVAPTIPVNYSIQDIIAGSDVEMEQIINLVSKK